ncbi:MAG: hypothetical protein IGR93_13160 [Hydrococcus sp. C42_A2020_068]|uniref:hypothetical protein n=1 Tax=Pleurocapsa sp. PCC 7327 TaxID=118163 RepID=UPI00029FC312|nr:hypothetical protein [Pleurocapsa sp. PCC 7327]AFY79445.1 hypothetical protein Ple7327_4334 [Pleurocapsa sp. PCC 7327]MBF2021020.1 hypothetical protein [Hydrococcus sp. C42_A2020_068]
MSILDPNEAANSYLFAFFWGIFVLLSCIGWGGAIALFLFPKDRVNWGQKAAWGIAFSIIFGGVLNLTWTISPTTIIILLSLGVIAWAVNYYQNRNLILNSLFQYLRDCQKDRLVLVSSILIIILIFVQYAGWVSTNNFHSHDDYHAYFVFPEKMLQIGSMGPDPFSERRLVSSLGGQSFLHTFVLSILSEQNLRLIDPGIASIAVFGLILGFIQEKNLLKRIAILILIPWLLIIPAYRNSTSSVIGLALFLSLFCTLNWDKLRANKYIANAVIIAAITAALCAAKTNLIPAAVIFLSSSYFFYIARTENKQKAILEFLAVIVLTFIFLLPWMISLYQSSGTLLYPLLGKGYHGSVYDEKYILPYSELLSFKMLFEVFKTAIDVDYIALVLLIISYVGLQLWRKPESKERAASVALTISACLGAAIVLLSTGGRSSRYTFPFVFAAIAVLTVIILSYVSSQEQDKLPKNWTFVLISAIALGMLIGSGNGWNASIEFYQSQLENIRRGIANEAVVFESTEVDEYTKMQRSVPAGETILTRLDKPFLLDFKRNQIFIIDVPCGASPLPGMPCFKGEKLLADYLTSQSIRYVAYAYISEPAAKGSFWKKAGTSHLHPWVRVAVEHTLDFHENLKKLGETRRRIYDDGNIFVIDLLNHNK